MFGPPPSSTLFPSTTLFRSMVWAWTRLHGRRDMIVLQATLRFQPLWGVELYRPGTVLDGDARQFAQREGWPESALEDLRVGGAGPAALALAADLVELVGGDRRRLQIGRAHV